MLAEFPNIDLESWAMHRFLLRSFQFYRDFIPVPDKTLISIQIECPCRVFEGQTFYQVDIIGGTRRDWLVCAWAVGTKMEY